MELHHEMRQGVYWDLLERAMSDAQEIVQKLSSCNKVHLRLIHEDGASYHSRANLARLSQADEAL